MNKKIKIISIFLISSSIYAEEMNQQTLQNFDIQLSLMTNKLHDIYEKLNMLYDGLNPLINILQRQTMPSQDHSQINTPATNIVSTINNQLATINESHENTNEISQEDGNDHSALIDNDPATADQMPVENETTQTTATTTIENTEQPSQINLDSNQVETEFNQPIMATDQNNMQQENAIELPKEATVLGEATTTVM